MTESFICAQCGADGEKDSSAYNRSIRIGAPIYCNRECAGIARRTDTRTPEQKRADKRAYDIAYREANREKLRRKHADYYAKVGPMIRDKEAETRRRKMPQHVEYCRQPQYRAKKHRYDVERVSSKYADYAEAHRLLVELEREIRRQMPDKYERLKLRGYYDRQNEKKRALRQAGVRR